MLLALATSQTDIAQAERLVKWIGWLSEKSSGSMGNQDVLLIFSDVVTETRLEQCERICALAGKIFARVHKAEVADPGCGWPGAANVMFKTAILASEEAQDDVFFLEPDGIPTRAGWLDVIRVEYEAGGKPFMGGLVPSPPHMTGIGVYPKDWRSYAPCLGRVPNAAGWDTYCAPEVNPHCHFTPLIQHIFKRHEPGWSIPGLNAVDKRAVIFHQDKHGKLIRLLDEANYGGACSRHPLFGYEEYKEDARVMTKFYATVNATKAVVSRSGKRFIFDPVESFGGSVPGLYATENPADQDLLSDLAQNPTTGVREIDQQEWERLAKKKWSHPVALATLRRSDGTSLSPTDWSLNSRPRTTQTPITPTPSRKAAQVVAEPVSTAGDPSAPPGLSQIKDINEVLRTDTVQPSHTAEAPKAKAKRASKKG